jgi:hypothetical protein
MSTINRIDFSVIPFPPTQWSGDIFQLAQLLAQHLQGNLDDSVFSGQKDGTEPRTDIGLWFNQDSWEHWDAILGKYVPIKLIAGISNNGVLHTATLNATNATADISLNLPSASGTLARIEDTTAPQATDTQAGNNIAIDWASAKVYCVIAGSCTVNDSGGGTDGKGVELFVETPPSNAVDLGITFPNSWHLVSGIGLSTTDSTHRAVDKFWIERIGHDTFVSKVAAFQIDQGGQGGDTTPPAYSSSDINVGSSTLRVHFSELIAGTTTPDKWIVKKNNNTQSIDNISISNTDVIIQLTNTVNQPDATLTVQYLANNQVRDLAGNFAQPFGRSDVDVIG